MSKIRDYQQAIRIFATGNFDAREVAVQLVEDRPDLFIKYVNRPGQQPRLVLSRVSVASQTNRSE